MFAASSVDCAAFGTREFFNADSRRLCIYHRDFSSDARRSGTCLLDLNVAILVHSNTTRKHFRTLFLQRVPAGYLDAKYAATVVDGLRPSGDANGGLCKALGDVIDGKAGIAQGAE
jgi:hypothetical protein